jgi:disulfide bond formation protein DsbB
VLVALPAVAAAPARRVHPDARSGLTWQGLGVTHDTVVALAALGVAGQVLAALLILAGVATLARVGRPWQTVGTWLWGYELWGAFVVAALATGGSLFFSEIAGFVPCELCWFQRICMYPLSILTLFAAAHGDHRFARYLLPLPVVGAGVSVYHLLVENHVVATPAACQIGAGCTVKWINEFGYMTIPTLALTGFVLLSGFLALAAADPPEPPATLPEHG